MIILESEIKSNNFGEIFRTIVFLFSSYTIVIHYSHTPHVYSTIKEPTKSTTKCSSSEKSL